MTAPATEVILTRAIQTCAAAPSQWHAWDAGGGYWYLRYRSGTGTMHRQEGRTDGPLRFTSADCPGSTISLAEFCARIGVTLAMAAPGA